MGKLCFSILDHSDSASIEEYEQALFGAFYRKCSVLLPLIWKIDLNERRLCSRIPYSDQEIIVGRLEGDIVCGVAINYAVDKIMQLEMLGFTIDKTEPGICEGRALFCLRMLANDIPVLVKMGEFAYHHLSARQIARIYGTCSSRMLRGYRNLGFNVVGEGMAGGEHIFLLEKSI